MFSRLADVLPATEVLAILTDDTLVAVESDPTYSTYTYRCGCVAVRFVASDTCSLRWCTMHRPLTGAHSTIALRRSRA